MELSVLLNQFLSGLTRAGVLFMLASGLTLIFGVARVINFAHGSLYMVAVYLSYSFLRLFGPGGMGFWLSLVAVALSLALIGGAIEAGLIRRIYGREHLQQLLLTFALIYIIGDAVKFVWGITPKSVSRPPFLEASIPVPGGSFPVYNLFVIGLAALVGVGLWLMLARTKLGWLIRAVAADIEITEALGVNVPRLLTLVFMVGTLLVGVGGAAAAPLTVGALGMDVEIVILCFIVVIIGGAGSLLGAAVAALLVGLLEAFGILALPQFAVVFIYALMAVVMIVRPWGLFGTPG
ncbi:MAG: branched-chain amino acid ABC transporter permease [Candidatus Rokubacteria bacterium]|nr:branched-chain amino acid ABC transporter permease [Candidatus Rokubacteria bacterium]